MNYKELITDDALDFDDVVSSHPNLVTVGGHTHTLEHLLAGGQRQEWKDAGLSELPNDQIVAGAVSGDWYSGGLNENGCALRLHLRGRGAWRVHADLLRPLAGNLRRVLHGAWCRPGTPAAHRHQLADLRGVGEEAQAWQDDDKAGDEPASIDPLMVSTEDLKDGKVLPDLELLRWFHRGDGVVLPLTVGMPWTPRSPSLPPARARTRAGLDDPISATENLSTTGNVAQSSPHLWRTAVPADLTPGEHTAEATATDRYGAEYTETVTFTVE